MKEKILYFDNLTPMEEIERILISFIGNTVSRKRNGMYSGSEFKTIMLNFPEKCGLKVTEHDGIDSHHHSEINLLRYFNGEEDHYLSVDDMVNPFLYNIDAKTIKEEDLAIRFSSGLDGLLVELDIPRVYTSFQLTNLILIMKLIKETREKNHYPRVEVKMRISSENRIFFCEDLNNEKYNEALNIINDLLSNVNTNTK